MIVVKCNRCGREIKDKYYTLAFTEESLIPKNQSITVSGEAIGAYYHTPESLLNVLNSKPMYCETCKDEIYEVINNKEVLI